MHIHSKILLALLALSTAFFTGCRKDESTQDLKVLRLMVESRGVDYGSLTGDVARLPVTGTKIPLQRDPVVNEFEIINVELVQVDMGLALLVQVSEKGARSLYRASVTNKGNRIVLMVNGNAIGARRLDRAIADGNLYSFVEIPDDQLGQLVLDLKESIVKIQKEK